LAELQIMQKHAVQAAPVVETDDLEALFAAELDRAPLSQEDVAILADQLRAS
jgi:hypothetical protein